MRKIVIVPVIIILAISGMFVAGNVKKANSSGNEDGFSLLENTASASVSSETPTSGTCCIQQGFTCVIGHATANNMYFKDDGKDCN